MKKVFKNKKFIIILGLIIILAVGSGVGYKLFVNKDDKTKDEVATITNNNYITDKFSEVKITDEESAKEALNDVINEIGVTNTNSDLKLVYETAVDDETFYRFKQYYQGIEVYNREILFESNQGTGENLIYNTITLGDFKTEYKHDEEAIKTVLQDYLKRDIEVEKCEKIIYTEDNEPVLAYILTIKDGEVKREFIVTDNEKVKENNYLISNYKGLDSLDSTFTLDSTGLYIPDSKIGIYTDQKVTYTDINNVTGELFGYFNNGIKTLVPGNNPSQYQVSALEYTNLAYRYFKEVLNHASFDGKGKAEINLFLSVDRTLKNGAFNYDRNNAMYMGYPGYEAILIRPCTKCKTYYSLPILGHEYAHGVMTHIVGVRDEENLEFESIGEGYADIFAILINQYFSGKLDFNLPDRNILKLDSTYNTSYTTNLNEDAHRNGTILSTAFYEITKRALSDNKALSSIFYRSLYFMPVNATLQESVNAILMAAKQSSLRKMITEGQFNTIREIFKEKGFQVEIDNLQKVKNSEVQFVKSNFAVCPVDKNGKYLSEYNIKIELYDKNDKLIKTILEKEHKAHGDDLCESVKADKLSENVYGYTKYYKITVTKDKAMQVQNAVVVDDKNVIKDGIYMYMDIEENNFLQVGQYKLPYGVYKGENPYDDNEGYSYYTLYEDGTFTFEREAVLPRKEPITLVTKIKGHVKTNYGIAEMEQTKKSWLIYFYSDEGSITVKETGEPYGYYDTKGVYHEDKVSESALYDVVQDNGFQERQSPMVYTYIGKTKNG